MYLSWIFHCLHSVQLCCYLVGIHIERCIYQVKVKLCYMLFDKRKFGFYVKCLHTSCIWEQYTIIETQFLWRFKTSTIVETISNFTKENLLNSLACVMDTNTKSQNESVDLKWLDGGLPLLIGLDYEQWLVTIVVTSRCSFSRFLGWVNLALTQFNGNRKIPTFITTITKKGKRESSVEDKIRTSCLGPVM